MHIQRENVLRLMELARLCRVSRDAGIEDKNAWNIKPDTERGKQLDTLITQGWSRERLKLLREIQNLSREGVSDLAALYWFGRGDAGIDMVSQHARSAFSPTLYYYLAEKENLAAGLQKALTRLSEHEANIFRNNR